MIDEHRVGRYCCEDISHIENYDKAMADTEQTWHCHHRAEILPCGNYSAASLKSQGMYWHRTASELIFLTESDHRKLHMVGSRNNMYGKRGKESNCFGRTGPKHPMYGKHHTEEARKKISTGLKGVYAGDKSTHWGKHWYTDGITSVLAEDCPDGFWMGRTLNGQESV